MSTESEITYFEHYKRCNDLSPAGLKRARRIYRKLFLGLLPAGRSVRILDFGCGAGMLLDWLKSEGYTAAEGVDIDSGQVDFARSLGLNAHLASDSRLWLKNAGQFDVIFLTDVIEHIPVGNDIALLSDLYDALKPGGVVVIRTPNANATFATRARYIDSTHLRVYTELSLHGDLESCHFEQIQILPDDVWTPASILELIATIVRFGFRCMRKLEAISEVGLSAMQMPLSMNLIAVARKPLK